MNLHEQKQNLRSTILARRAELTAQERAEKSRQINSFLNQIEVFNQARRVFCFISYQTEVHTHGLITAFLQQNRELAVPKIVGKTEMLAVPLRDWADLEPDGMGILTPVSHEIMPDPFDLVVTPGVGFSETGDRLGYGRGYYDRWFGQNEVGTRIGVCFEVQLSEQIPMEKTDVPLDMVVTENRIIDLRQ